MNDDRISEVYKGEIWSDEAQARARRRIDWMCSSVVGDTILDIGCSQGIASILLGREGFRVTGIDIQEDRIEYARADLANEPPETRARVSFEVGSGGDLRFDDASFDSVLMGEVIEHLAQPGRLLAEVTRVLKPGGRVALTTPFGSLHHHDHRQTFFPRPLLELIGEHLGVVSVAIEDRYFRIVATNDPADALDPAEALAQLEAHADRTVIGIQDELTDLKRRDLRSQRETSDLLRRQQTLQTEVTTLKKQTDEAKRSRVALSTEIERLKAAVDAANRQREASTKTLEATEGRLKETKKELSAARSRVAALEKSVKRLSEGSRAQALEERIHKLELDRWKLREGLALERWKLRSIRNRKWWRIGGLLAAVRRKPWRILVLPFDLVSLLAGTTPKIPRPQVSPKPERRREKRPTANESGAADVTKTARRETRVIDRRHRHAPAPARLLVAAAILDAETSAGLAHEWQLFDLEPDTWRSVLNEQRPDLLIVDIRSSGRNESWAGKFGGANPLSIDVAQMLEAFGSNGVPRLMLADHPPAEVQQHLGTAAYFDGVASFDADTVAGYANAGVEASLLPPGVQTMRFNPVDGGRRGNVVLVDDGALPVSLGPAAKEATGFDLRIHPIGGAGTAVWPNDYSESIAEDVDPDRVPDIFPSYKIALVPAGDSRPSDAALRAAASGTPTIAVAGTNNAIPHLDPADNSEARTVLRYLMRADDERTRLGHRALRTAVREFPLVRTADAMLRAVGIEPMTPSAPHVTIMAPTNRPDRVEAILQNAARQTYRDLDLVIAHHGFSLDRSRVTDRAAELGISEVSFVEVDESVPAGEAFNQGFRAARGDLIGKMDDDDYYGAEYLADQVDAFSYTRADIVGKWAHYTYLEDLDSTILRYPQHEHEYRDVLAISTLLIKRHIFETVEFPPMPVGSGSVFLRAVRAQGGRVYSADRFNYLYVRYSDRNHHTFPVSAYHLAANALTICRGRNEAHVDA